MWCESSWGSQALCRPIRFFHVKQRKLFLYRLGNVHRSTVKSMLLSKTPLHAVVLWVLTLTGTMRHKNCSRAKIYIYMNKFPHTFALKSSKLGLLQAFSAHRQHSEMTSRKRKTCKKNILVWLEPQTLQFMVSSLIHKLHQYTFWPLICHSYLFYYTRVCGL